MPRHTPCKAMCRRRVSDVQSVHAGHIAPVAQLHMHLRRNLSTAAPSVPRTRNTQLARTADRCTPCVTCRRAGGGGVRGRRRARAGRRNDSALAVPAAAVSSAADAPRRGAEAHCAGAGARARAAAAEAAARAMAGEIPAAAGGVGAGRGRRCCAHHLCHWRARAWGKRGRLLSGNDGKAFH
eukprot:365810-Chlamydomonas_euryale.AAC.33